MQRIVLLFSILLVMLSGCTTFSDSGISSAQAKSIVINNHTKDIGEVEIISVRHKRNMYIIKWANKENCENGVDYVHDKKGEIVKGETSIC
ncbi:hypothetical protein ACWV26_10435 [Rummeliibacillus sp. JY-2-4R]